MGARVEVLPWERQPREGEEAYAAFLAYRDLGPSRTHEATRKRLGKRPGYLKPIERWSALRDWRRRPAPGTPTCKPSATRSPRRRRRSGSGAGSRRWRRAGRLCRALRARLRQMLASPGDAGRRPARAGPGEAGGHPRRRRDARGGQGDGRTRATRWNYLTVARLSKLVVELEWALLNEALPPPGKIDPLTATPEEIKAYLALHPRFGRPPPR